MATTGGEPPDAATVRGAAGQDRDAALASGVGERLVDEDFGDEGDMGGQGVEIIGWEGGSLGLPLQACDLYLIPGYDEDLQQARALIGAQNEFPDPFFADMRPPL